MGGERGKVSGKGEGRWEGRGAGKVGGEGEVSGRGEGEGELKRGTIEGEEGEEVQYNRGGFAVMLRRGGDNKSGGGRLMWLNGRAYIYTHCT